MNDLKEHEFEPIRGLPAPLPAGEAILWQGAPDWGTLNRRAMRLRWVSVYFLGLVLWGISGGVSAGDPALQITLSALRLIGLGAVAVAVLALFAYLVARTTIYTVTNRRVVIRFGILRHADPELRCSRPLALRTTTRNAPLCGSRRRNQMTTFVQSVKSIHSKPAGSASPR